MEFDDDEHNVPDDSPAFCDQSIPAANVGSPAQTRKSCRISTLETAHYLCNIEDPARRLVDS